MGVRAEKKSQSRRRLVEAAYRLFSEQGYDQTSVEEIAAAAAVSRATLFNYFPSKSALIFTDGEQIAAAGVARIEARGADEDPVDALADAFMAMIDSTVGTSRDPDTELEVVRIRLVLTTSQLRAEFLDRSLASLKTIADAMKVACPELDVMTVDAMVGAVFGAALAAGSRQAQSGALSREVLTRSVSLVAEALRTTHGFRQ
ncbi:TetR/AcrR family transcriptional regulator [Brevibacterium aurantiacum]|uniref:TetR/AcrR family transcriptional regulator n=1 Tax=Brevibacterium aurantiacum TaxID=273384 RepID=UPI001866F646|nr:TetR/AcrR family transcriptional regulator [Brevibacterium aurantiacum]